MTRLSDPPLASLAVIILGVLLFFVNLDHPLYTKGEPREGVQIEDVVEGRGAILPRVPSVEMPFKPPMMRWLASLVSKALGRVDEFTIRAPSATLAIGTMLVTRSYVGLLFGQVEGLVAALILGTTLQFMQAGTGARVDMTLTFFLSLAFFEFFNLAEGRSARWFVFYLAVACAVLSKGPLGLILPTLVGGTWILFERRQLNLSQLMLKRGAVLVGILAGGWYVAASWIGGREFVERQIVAENFYAFFSHRELGGGHNHPFYWLVAALLFGFLPYSPVLPWLSLKLIRCRSNRGVSYLVIWVLVVLVFFSVARQKRGVYLLALYPALAGLLSVYLVEHFYQLDDACSVGFRILKYACALISGAAGLGFLGLLLTSYVAPFKVEAGLSYLGLKASGLGPNLNLALWSHPWLALTLGLAPCSIAAVVLARPVAKATVFGFVVALMVCFKLCADLFFVPAIARTLTLKTFASELPRIVGRCEVAYAGNLSYSVAFYYRRQIPMLAQASEWSSSPPYLLIWRKEYDRLSPVLHARYAPVMWSGPTELDGSGGILLLRRVDLAQNACR